MTSITIMTIMNTTTKTMSINFVRMGGQNPFTTGEFVKNDET
jgi:hypothetical protein